MFPGEAVSRDVGTEGTVKAKALGKDPVHTEVFDDWTGVLYMWNRLDVEYIVGKSAAPLDLTKIPPQFGNFCAQLDFVTTELGSDPTFAPDPSDTEAEESILVTRAKTLAKNFGKPGWLFLVSLKTNPDAKPTPTQDELKWFASGAATRAPAPGDATLGTTNGATETYLADIDPALWSGIGSTLSAKLEWDGKVRPAVVKLTDAGAQRDNAKRTTVEVRSTDEYQIHFGFEPIGVDPIGMDVRAGGEEALVVSDDLRVLPTMQRPTDNVGLPNALGSANNWLPGGWGTPEKIAISLRQKSWGVLLGVTHWPVSFIYTDPILTVPPPGSLSSEAGTTLHTAVHELTHNFGMVSDQCGFWDWKRDRACCMTYSNQWMLHPQKLEVGSYVEIDCHVSVHEERLRPVPIPAPMGLEHCGRHIVVCRRVRWTAHPKALGW